MLSRTVVDILDVTVYKLTMNYFRMKELRMNLYLIRQDVNNGYDTYDSAVVVANSEDGARAIHPDGRSYLSDGEFVRDYGHDGHHAIYKDDTWSSPETVSVMLLGKADKNLCLGGVVCASFNAG